MMSVENLPDFQLSAEGAVGRRFATLGLSNYNDAARHVWKLPYGRNSDRSDWRLLLEEECGTCSIKHVLLAELAREHDQPVSFVLDIYEMSEANTPGAWVQFCRSMGFGASQRATAASCKTGRTST
jgi:hypothetical protein